LLFKRRKKRGIDNLILKKEPGFLKTIRLMEPNGDLTVLLGPDFGQKRE